MTAEHPESPTRVALFLDGWSALEQPVRVAIREHTVVVSDEQGRPLASWSAAGLSLDAMLEGDTVHVTHDSAAHETLVVHDRQLAAELLALAPRARKLPGGERKGWFALACLAAIVAVAGGLYAVSPAVARFIAFRIPLEQERALGAELEALLSLSLCEDPKATALLGRLTNQLSQGAGYEARILDHGEPNAFALPGGVVLVTTGLLQSAESGDEVAGVLAHEVEHVAQRHVLSGFIRDALFTALWSLTAGDYAGMMVVDPSTAYRVYNLRFSRDDEQSADHGAVTRLHRLGASHRGLTSFFERLRKRYGSEGPTWLSTHPATEARIRELGRAQDVHTPRPLLTSDELAQLKAACATEAPEDE